MVSTSSTAPRAGLRGASSTSTRSPSARRGPWPGRPAGRSSNLAKKHTTVSVERATLRLAGLQGADADGIPWVNRLLDAVRGDVGLEHGIALPVWDALVRGEADDLSVLAQKASAGWVRFRLPEGRDLTRARTAAGKQVGAGIRRVDARRRDRERMVKRYGDPEHQPWIYLIVATGDIYEDIPQAQQAAREGADVIAVIRSTGQSLLDYVPEGATREGFAGTYATQENFRLMRAALDESSKELGRYVRLTNYASGLCMPEIAALAGLERLDMMLNDSMYGILFRDINPIRTFVDQRFSRQVHARAGIIINTGEDNYLTTADAVEAAHTVTVSQLLNEYFAKEAGLEDWQLGLGHAFEINPEVPDSFRMELAHALLARELFPKAPLKWMPPTRHMTGDVFRGYLLDAFFNLAGVMTGQSILLVGMMTEAVVTPWLSDRDLALQNVRYVMEAAGKLHEDFVPRPDGFIVQRAHQVLAESIDLLERILAHESKTGLLDAIADGTFGLMKRPADAGRGLDGVARQGARLLQPRDRDPGGEGMSILRPYGDTTGDGMVQVSFTLPMANSKVAEGAAAQLANKMGIEPALVVHAKAMGPDFTFFVVYGRVNHLVDTSQVEVVERDYPLLTPKEVNARDQERAAPPADGRRRLHRHRRAHRRHRRDPEHQGVRRREGPGVLPRAQGREPRRPGVRAAARRPGARGEGRRHPGLPGGHPARRAHREHQGDVRGVPGVLPQRQAAAADRRRSPLRREDGRRARRGPGLRPRYDARRGRLLHHPPAGHEPEEGRRMSGPDELDQPESSGTRVTHRRYVPYSHAHYAGNLVDGAYSLGPVRRRRDRGVHPHRRRRGAVRVVLRRAVPGPRAGR